MAAIVKGNHDLPALLTSMSMLWLLPSCERIQGVLTLKLIAASARRFDRVQGILCASITVQTAHMEIALTHPETAGR